MILTYEFTHIDGDDTLEIAAESFEEASHIMFSGEHGLHVEDWELTDTW